ncbi:carbohydrate sulfotransferase 1-like [Antedon mediterranea]|uniref:carbohydrate sulfotransferase 1-like n=1 Tax=Antedon mediterranea TaxID=105859 RepID=UPI003AF5DD59
MKIKRLFILLCMIVLLSFMSTMFLYGPILNSGQVTQHQEPLLESHYLVEKKRAQVVLMTFRRSGSTFTGELFGNNMRSFYLFEPLHFLRFFNKRPVDPGYIKNVSRSTLEAILSCQFTKLPFHTIWYHDFPDYMCYYGSVLRNTSFCSSTRQPISAIYREMNNRCKQSDFVAIKTIRLFKIKHLERFAVTPGTNLKVIHLVRDPRGTINSNKRHFRTSVSNITSLSRDLCNFIATTRQRVKDKSIWNGGSRYMELKYEDLSLNPLKISKQIYDFIGFNLPNEIVTWIGKNTNVTNFSNGSMVVAKDSKTVPFAWRQTMNLQDVLDVQAVCEPVMKQLGYRLVKTENDLRDTELNLM